jgi:hypothetical protein
MITPSPGRSVIRLAPNQAVCASGPVSTGLTMARVRSPRCVQFLVVKQHF